jgi:hypothetical protein
MRNFTTVVYCNIIAYDAGGLLRQWLGDFFSALRSYPLPINGLNVYFDKGINQGASSSSASSSTPYISAFESNGNTYLPPAIYMDNCFTQPFSFNLFNNVGEEVEEDNLNTSKDVGEYVRSNKKIGVSSTSSINKGSSKATKDTLAFIKSLYCTVGKAINQVSITYVTNCLTIFCIEEKNYFKSFLYIK